MEAEITNKPKRRMRSKAERRRIVEETLEPGASVARVARAHDVNANQVFHWRRLYRTGCLEEEEPANTLLPVTISHRVEERRQRGSNGLVRRPASGTIDIDLGHARVRIDGKADPACVRAALEGLIGDCATGGHANLDRDRGDGHAQGVSGAERDRADGSGREPVSGHVFVFRGRRGDLIKLLWWDGDGLCLFAQRLERGRFIWPQAESGTVSLSPAQLSMLLEGIDWRRPVRTQSPMVML